MLACSPLLDEMPDPLTLLQTVAAVGELMKAAKGAVVFLHKVRNADKVAAEVYDRVERLAQVLEGVKSVLEDREERGGSPKSPRCESVEERIRRSVAACKTFLDELEKKVGGYDIERINKTSTDQLLLRFRIAIKKPSIAKRQVDLEARISQLQTDLVVLQL